MDFRPAFRRRDTNVVEFRLRHSRQLGPFPLAPTPQLQRASPTGETWRRVPDRDMRQCDPQHVILLGDWRPQGELRRLWIRHAFEPRGLGFSAS
jgi:hypothetical protein